MLRFGVFLILLVSFGSVTPSLAQSLQAQEYYFNTSRERLGASSSTSAEDECEGAR